MPVYCAVRRIALYAVVPYTVINNLYHSNLTPCAYPETSYSTYTACLLESPNSANPVHSCFIGEVKYSACPSAIKTFKVSMLLINF